MAEKQPRRDREGNENLAFQTMYDAEGNVIFQGDQATFDPEIAERIKQHIADEALYAEDDAAWKQAFADGDPNNPNIEVVDLGTATGELYNPELFEKDDPVEGDEDREAQ